MYLEYYIKQNDDGSINVSETGNSIYYGDYRVVFNIFKTAFHIFGELFIDEKLNDMDPSECQITLVNGFRSLNFWW